MEATVVYPHQLFANSPALSRERSVYIVEEPLVLTRNPIHRQKLILHKLSLDAYQRTLEQQGYTAYRLCIDDHTHSTDVFTRLKEDGITKIHIVDTTDNYLEQAITDCGITRVWYESPLFILSKNEAVTRYCDSKKFMATFYKSMRKDFKILVTDTNKPVGDQWSFDAENRKKIPKDISLPADISFFGNTDTVAAEAWAETVPAEQYGQAKCWLPYTHAGAEAFLQEFLSQRFQYFGTYEDAMTKRGTRLYHSALSPLMNLGLLTPMQVLESAIMYAKKNNVPINSLEGFVRQILGWREFIRASYECDGSTMRTSNFFQHKRSLPSQFWKGTTGIEPVDHAITTALTYGYNHHIERLMILGNIMLLCQTNPDDVYRWFMGMYVDAYDWVMVPNVYGMSQFADGGTFATKPYISGSNYIKKMSDFSPGRWEEIWTALYWNFIATHKEFFTHNHRLSMMPRLLDNMDATTKTKHFSTAKAFMSAET